MVQGGLKWFKMVQGGRSFQNGQRHLKHRKKKTHFAYIRPERRRREGWQQKMETLDHPPLFYGSIFFLCSFLFSLFKSFLCSNLSIWPDRPVVPNGSRCYISILDGLVLLNKWMTNRPSEKGKLPIESKGSEGQ